MKFCLFMLLSISAFSQIEINGLVIDNQEQPIPRVSITITPVNSENILAFAISDAKGHFNINFTSILDSLMINANGLGFAKQSKLVLSKNQSLLFRLEEEAINLKEITVKRDPISKFGDTLSYSVLAFKDQNDRVIGDVIKKLPGIEIEPNGTIKYQGNAINKFYIDGLDLLGGKYGLANENLNVDAVTDVKIMENHQPIRILDSLEFSSRAALNIKLKKNITTTGKVSLAAGLSPLLYEANITPMLFTKKRQFLGSFQANNIGEPIGKQLNMLIVGADNFETNNRKEEWLGIQQLSKPPFSEKRWLDNNAQLGTLNFLEKLNNGLELRVNSDFLNDTQYQRGYTQTYFFSGSLDTLSLFENKVNAIQLKKFTSDIILEKNSKTKYFKNSLKFNGFWDSQLGIIDRSTTTINQRLTVPYYMVSNTYKDIFKVGKQLVTLNSYIKIDEAPQELNVQPGQFISIFGDAAIINQKLNLKGFYTHNAASFTRSIFGVSLRSELGFLLEKKTLKSSISQLTDNPNFSNNLNWQYNKYYIENKFQYSNKGWKFTFLAPLSLNDFNISDTSLSKNQEVNKLIFEPRLSVNKEFAKFWRISGSSNIGYSFGDINQVHYGYILEDYRSLSRRNAPLSENKSWNNSFSMSYRNPLNSIFSTLLYSHSITNANLIYSTLINEDGTSELNVLAEGNASKRELLSYNLGKYFSKIKTNIKIGASYFKNSGPQLINEEFYEIVNTNFRPKASISSTLAGWIEGEYEYTVSLSKNNLQNELSEQQSHKFNLSFYPNKKSYLGFNSEYYSTKFRSTNTSNIFSDIIGRYTIGKRKVDFELQVSNIFNSKSLVNISTDSFTQIETQYQLRPRQILTRVRFSF